MTEKPLVVAVTGASGAAYAVRLLRVLLTAGRDVHAVFSPAAVQVFRDELHAELVPATLDLRDRCSPCGSRGATGPPSRCPSRVWHT